MRHLRTEIQVDATAERVWSIISDFASYAKWNTFIPFAQGEASVGSTVQIAISIDGTKPQPYHVTVTLVERQRKLGWLGHFLFPGLIDGHHSFELVPLEADGVLLIHSEDFKGFLVPFVWNHFLNTKMRRGFIEMNELIKKRAEAR